MILASEQESREWLKSLPEWNELARERLEALVALLIEENARQNLVSASSIGDVWRRHIVDSAQLLVHVPRETRGPWLDLGTGAGFPGLVIATMLPDCEVILVESRARRIDWLGRAISSLDLSHVAVEGRRLELVPDRKVRTISARAFAPLPRLLDLSARFSTSDTVWVLPKGRSAQQELDMLSGWQHMFHVEQSLTDSEAGIVVGSVAGKTRKKGKQP